MTLLGPKAEHENDKDKFRSEAGVVDFLLEFLDTEDAKRVVGAEPTEPSASHAHLLRPGPSLTHAGASHAGWW